MKEDKKNKKKHKKEDQESKESNGSTVEASTVEPLDWEEKYKRALAENQNLLKQTAREKEEFIKYASERVLQEIIPVFDNLKISMKFADEDVKNNGWAQGVEYIIKQFRDVLNNLGVEEIKTEGEKFDPTKMEAVSGEGDKVKKEVKSGYTLNGKVIVPARVELD